MRSLGISILVLFLVACGINNNPSAPTIIVPAGPLPTATARAERAPSPVRSSMATAEPMGAATPQAVAPADLRELTLGLELIAEGFTQPLYVTGAGDGSGRLFVVEQPGTIWIVRNGQRLERPFLDIVDQVGSQANEQGLLSIAFSPDYARDGLFFINYTDLDGNTVVARYQVTDDPDRANVNSARTILTIEQPAANHNGGLLKFGPDGYLYVGTGDGGRAGDPWNNAQSRTVLLGKLLRIDVMNVVGDQPYAIPADNPFVGEPNMRPEIWAWGLRNPWRFAFDRETGDLYIADVGQNRYEEVHFQPADSAGGENYGWNIMEGATCYNADECDQTGLEKPIVVYSHALGCSITGGYVYRGRQFPQLDGIYFYGDYCSGRIWGLRQIDQQWDNAEVLQTDLRLTSFGEDDVGEIYLTDHNGGVYQLVVR